MTEQQTEQPAASELAADDLKLVEALTDAGKDDAELWDEFSEAESDAPAATKPSDDDAQDWPSDDEPPAEETGEPDPAPAATDEAATDDQPDVWASAPPELKEAYETERKAREKAEQRLKSDEGRVAAYQRRYEDLLKAAQPRPRTEHKSPREALAKLAEDYPELAGPLSEAFEATEARLNETEQVEKSRQEAARQELSQLVDAETAKVAEAHPGYAEFLNANGAAFAAWVEDQPRTVREAAYRNAQWIANAEEAIGIIERFKAHIAPPADKPAAQARPEPKAQTQPLNDRRARQLGATASPRSSSRPTVSGVPESGSDEEIWAAFDAKEAAEQRR